MYQDPYTNPYPDHGYYQDPHTNSYPDHGYYQDPHTNSYPDHGYYQEPNHFADVSGCNCQDAHTNINWPDFSNPERGNWGINPGMGGRYIPQPQQLKDWWQKHKPSWSDRGWHNQPAGHDYPPGGQQMQPSVPEPALGPAYGSY